MLLRFVLLYLLIPSFPNRTSARAKPVIVPWDLLKIKRICNTSAIVIAK
jgi:hypothetical protein